MALKNVVENKMSQDIHMKLKHLYHTALLYIKNHQYHNNNNNIDNNNSKQDEASNDNSKN